jgi:hypothetical protein
VVTIRDVLVSLSPNRELNVKRVLLQKQLYDWKALAEDEFKIDPQSKLGRLVSKVIDNLVVVIEDVHIRMEDVVTLQPSWHGDKDDPSRCFSIGITLDRFELKGSVVGLDGEWANGCEKKALRFLNKAITVGDKKRIYPGQERHARRHVSPAGFGVYCHCGERPLSISDPGQWAREMRDFIASADWKTRNQWLAGPVTAALKVSIYKIKEFNALSSRCWPHPQIKESEFRVVDLLPAAAHTITLEISAEKLTAGDTHIYWVFETTRFGVMFQCETQDTHRDASDTGEAADAGQTQDSHLQRVYGKTTVLSAGQFTLVWKSPKSKGRVQELKYAAWIQVDGPNGELERVHCDIPDADNKKLAVGDYATWVKSDKDVPKVRTRNKCHVFDWTAEQSFAGECRPSGRLQDFSKWASPGSATI